MSNKAAWLIAPKARPFKVDDAPMPTPEPHEVVVRNYAVAINPVDYGMQAFDILIKSYPYILGNDGAGEIAAVGSAVTNFQIGDRVLATFDTIGTQKPTNSAFQLYAATTSKLVAKLPSHISYTQGAVLPLAISTAAAGLFQKDTMALPYPQLKPEPTGKVLLVWGGSSSVGTCAIQLAKAAGFDVATTASSRNHEYCKSLGAAYVFDYTKDSVVDDIVSTLKGKDFAGVFDAVSKPDSLTMNVQIITRLGGPKLLQTVRSPRMPSPEGIPSDITVGKGKKLEIRTRL
jgi:NADPH:quinone reductase-like Zn-dependent oxidoreductase